MKMNKFIWVPQAPHTDLDDGTPFAQFSPLPPLQTPWVEQAPHTDLESISFAQPTQSPTQLMLLITKSTIKLSSQLLIIITDYTPVLVTDVTNQWTIQTCPQKQK